MWVGLTAPAVSCVPAVNPSLLGSGLADQSDEKRGINDRTGRAICSASSIVLRAWCAPPCSVPGMCCASGTKCTTP